MLTNPTRDKLQELRLTGMHAAYEEQRQSAACDSLTFEERLGLLVDREYTERHNRRLKTRLRGSNRTRGTRCGPCWSGSS